MDDLRNSINLNSEIQDLRIQLAQLQGKMSKMYSEEDMKEAYKEGMNTEYKFQQKYLQRNTFDEWLKQFKKK
jgi:uncharacterized alpha-E superfamily protein